MSDVQLLLQDDVNSQAIILPELQSMKSARVLLIEDDRTTRRMVSQAIGDYCSLTEAFNAGHGVARYQHFAPDIVFLDLELPDVNGHTILEWIMRNDPGAYVVMFSGKDDDQTVQKALDYGAKGFVSKPFEAERMIYHICQCPKFYSL